MKSRVGILFPLVAAGALGVSCDREPVAPGAPTLEVVLAFAEGPLASPAAAFDKADRLTIEVTGESGWTRTRTCDIPAGQQTISCEVTELELQEGARGAEVSAELAVGDDPIFDGGQEVELTPGRITEVEILLHPVPYSVEPSSSFVQLVDIGQQVQLTASVVFVTGDEIPGSPVVWSALPGSTGIDITSEGLLTAAGNGNWQVAVASGELSAVVDIEVAAVAVVEAVSPSSVAAGQEVTLEIQGRNLHGAVGVGVCGWAAVGSTTAGPDGTWATVNVLWPAYTPFGESQASPACAVGVSTPQGSPAGFVQLEVIAPPPAPTLLSHGNADGFRISIWDAAAGTVIPVAGPLGTVDYLRFAPDGNTATVATSASGEIPDTDVFELDLASGGLTGLTAPAGAGGHNSQFVWDPTGGAAVFRRCDGAGCWLWDWVAGSETNRGVDGWNPLTPEYRQVGQLLYASHYVPGEGCVPGGTHRIQRWGSPEPTTLAGGDPCCWTEQPRLSPDGSLIAYTLRELTTGISDLYTMTAAGSGHTLRKNNVQWISWATDDWILFSRGGALHGLELGSGQTYLLLSLNDSGILLVDRR